MLKVLINKEEFDKMHEALQAEYKKGEGEDANYVLDSDDTSFTSKISEFRNNNIKIAKERDTLKNSLEKFKDIDPEKYKETKQKLLDLEDKKLLDDGDLETLLNTRTERMRSDFEGKTNAQESALQEERKKRKVAEVSLAKVVIDSEVQLEAGKVGTVKKGAMTDILSRARSVFQLQEGKPVPVGSDGNTLYGTDGNNPLTIAEWTASLVQDVPYLFEGSSGGGGGGDHGAGGGDDKTLDSPTSLEIGKNLKDIASGKLKIKINQQV